jgi:hypothetical protein
MTVAEGPRSAGLVARVQNIILHPKAEWAAIDGESTTVQGLFTGYAMVLAAIPAIAQAIGGFLPICLFGVCIHLNPISVIVGAVIYYIAELAGVYVIGLVIDALAPSFGGQKNPTAAMKVAVYSFTAYWLAGIFAIFPPLAILSLVGLYSFYLLFVGLPVLMKAPQDKALGYTAVSILIGIVVFIIIAAIEGVIRSMGSAMPGVTVG